YTNYEAGPAQVVSPRANTPPGTLTAWQISDVYEAAFQPPNSPPRNARWEDVEVEDEGIVNVSRYRAKLLRNERREKSVNKDLVFARVRIHSDHDQVKKLWLGYSDEVLAMLNGTPIYEGKASFGHRYPFSLGIVGTDNDAIYLPLKKGDNELVLAVSEIFGGWGFVGRFDDLSGLRLPD
ncbi:MAG: hypothetical protein KDI19_06780, partial [Pseudomonadales bacterium]|nr:hypothetical protein [Pseudomonadales bacterium]